MRLLRAGGGAAGRESARQRRDEGEGVQSVFRRTGQNAGQLDRDWSIGWRHVHRGRRKDRTGLCAIHAEGYVEAMAGGRHQTGGREIGRRGEIPLIGDGSDEGL